MAAENGAGWRLFPRAHAGSSCDFHSQSCCTRPNRLQHKPARILPTFHRAVYSSVRKALWHFGRRGSVSQTFPAAAPSLSVGDFALTNISAIRCYIKKEVHQVLLKKKQYFLDTVLKIYSCGSAFKEHQTSSNCVWPEITVLTYQLQDS